MIDEKENRWFQFSWPSRRVNPFVDPGAYRPPDVTYRPQARFDAYDRFTRSRTYESLGQWSREAFRLARLTHAHPTVKITGVVVAAFVIMMSTSGALSSALMGDLPQVPELAALSHALGAPAPASADPDAGTSNYSAQPPAAVAGIPAGVMTLYQQAAQTCGVPWETLAAIGRVETNHGASDAPGVHNGANYAGAEGPMQFMAGTWAKYGVDADHDGNKNVYDQTDAIFGAAKYLCANGASQPGTIESAIWHYNHDNAYVDGVMKLATTYRAEAYVLPVSDAVAKTVNLGEPHHDYPADDIDMPVGTQIYAVRGGTAHVAGNSTCGNELIIDGSDGFTYTYCHASSIETANGATVNTGDPILRSGGARGAPGAGDSTGPHLHLQIAAHGKDVCPQPLLNAWQTGQFMSPDSAPDTGCFN